MAGLSVEWDTACPSLEKEHTVTLKKGSVHFTVNNQHHEMPLRRATWRGFSNTEHISKPLVSVWGLKFSKGMSLNLLLY